MKEEIKILDINCEQFGFKFAKQTSEREARKRFKEPMLIAWYDLIKGEEYPRIPLMDNKPGWIAYAESHDGCLRIDINEGLYSFIYAETALSKQVNS